MPGGLLNIRSSSAVTVHAVLFQVDQGLNVRVPLPGGKSSGLSGGLYNRVMASYTKFMQLPFLPKLTEDAVWIDRKVRGGLYSYL